MHILNNWTTATTTRQKFIAKSNISPKCKRRVGRSKCFNCEWLMLLLLWSVTIECIFSQETEIEIIEADLDYPLLSAIPNTGFACDGRSPGYYADDHPMSSCQVFHYCHHDGRIFDFLCPNSTIFNQQVFACDHFYNFQCNNAKEYYMLNDIFFNSTYSVDYNQYEDDNA